MLMIAHRGFSSQYPENTALSFESAIAAGANLIETDLRLSRDGAIVCCHDPDLKRIAGQTDKLDELSLTEIKSVTLPNDQQILTLDEVLQIANHRVRVMLDVKITTTDMLKRALPIIEDIDMAADVVYGARNIDHINELRRLNDQIFILGMPTKMDLISEFIKNDVDAVRLWEEDVSSDNISQIKSAGKPVWVTAGLRRQGELAGEITRDRILLLQKFKVDAVLANDPSLVLRTLQQDHDDVSHSAGLPA